MHQIDLKVARFINIPADTFGRYVALQEILAPSLPPLGLFVAG